MFTADVYAHSAPWDRLKAGVVAVISDKSATTGNAANFLKTGNGALTLSPSGSGNTYTTTVEQYNLVINTNAPSGGTRL